MLKIIKLDNPLPHYNYEAITVQHTFIKTFADNKPFLCERGKFMEDDCG